MPTYSKIQNFSSLLPDGDEIIALLVVITELERSLFLSRLKKTAMALIYTTHFQILA